MQEELNLERDWYELELASGASWNTQNFLEGTTLRLPIIDFRVDDCCSYPVLSVELCTELTFFLLHFTCRVLYQLHLFFFLPNIYHIVTLIPNIHWNSSS